MLRKPARKVSGYGPFVWRIYIPVILCKSLRNMSLIGWFQDQVRLFPHSSIESKVSALGCPPLKQQEVSPSSWGETCLRQFSSSCVMNLLIVIAGLSVVIAPDCCLHPENP